MQNGTDILIYQTEDGNTKIDVRLENETVWMTQKAIAELYQKGVNTINEHIKNIYAEGELGEAATIRKNRIVQTEGKRDVEREVSFYNLEMILAIGYRVRSHRGTQFRLITIQKQKLHKDFLLLFKTNYTLLSMVKRRLN